MVTPKKRAPKKPRAPEGKPSLDEAVEAPAETSSPGSEAPEPKAPRPAAPSPTDLSAKLAASISLMCVVLLAVLVNILAARHYRRWDMTKGGEFTLSDGTIDTLRSLDEPIKILVMIPRDVPISTSVAEMLDGYRQYTNKLDIEFVDPDRDQAHLVDLQKKYGLTEAGSRGQIEAAMVVIQGERHQFVQPGDLVAVDDPSDLRTRPRLEYAITSAIRTVRSAEAPVVCFTTGHNVLSLDVG